jgi:hypothetical protein
MILIINSCQPEKIFLALRKNGQTVMKNYFCADFLKVEKFLYYLNIFLSQYQIKLDELKGIAVVLGPGSFTSVRLGVVIANALGFSLAIPAAGIKADEFTSTEDLFNVGIERLKKIKKGVIAIPFYNKPPHITQARSRNYRHHISRSDSITC